MVLWALPNVGKSTLFNCLTSLQVPAENYPFCTTDPHRGRVPVPDERLRFLSRLFVSEKTTPTFMEFVDIAGLVKGASRGEGLGNRFLSHIRQTQALVHVIRCFKDSQITHTQGDVDPLRDKELVEMELLMADLQTLENQSNKLKKLLKGPASKELLIKRDLIQKLTSLMSQEEKPAREFKPSPEEQVEFDNLQLLTAKPLIYVFNTDEEGMELSQQMEKPQKPQAPPSGKMMPQPKKNVFLQGALPHPHPLKTMISQSGIPPEKYLTLLTPWEAEIAALPSEEEKNKLLHSLNLPESGLNRLIKKSYKLLDLITFFTAGKKESRAWTTPSTTPAPRAGGLIHTDFERGFIRAEVYGFEDLKKHSSLNRMKEAGLIRQEGKNYIIRDGDVVLFKFNV